MPHKMIVLHDLDSYIHLAYSIQFYELRAKISLDSVFCQTFRCVYLVSSISGIFKGVVLEDVVCLSFMFECM